MTDEQRAQVTRFREQKKSRNVSGVNIPNINQADPGAGDDGNKGPNGPQNAWDQFAISNKRQKK
jgi:hypothetical protein